MIFLTDVLEGAIFLFLFMMLLVLLGVGDFGIGELCWIIELFVGVVFIVFKWVYKVLEVFQIEIVFDFLERRGLIKAD